MGKEEQNGNRDGKNYTGYDNSFGTYMWNSETRECFGRTAGRWVKLIIFYVIFYIGLACFAGLCYYLFSTTLYENRPKWLLDESLIGSNPGLGFRPMPDPDNNADSTLIWYMQGDDKDTKFWSKQLEKYVTDATAQQSYGANDKPVDCRYDNGAKASQNTSCSVDASGKFGNCISERDFGYTEGSPCILLKLNKILGWEPEAYGIDSNGKYDATLLKEELEELEKKGMPKKLIEDINKGVQNHKNKERYLSTIWVSCAGETKMDQENIGPLEYFPQEGIPGYYFPYLNQQTYQSPFVFVQLSNPNRGSLVNVECKAWARNIKHDRINRQGSVHFEILVDQMMANKATHNHG